MAGPQTGIARRDPRDGEDGSALRVIDADPVFSVSIAHMQRRMAALEQAKKDLLDERTDYMTIPGTQKPSLLKPGAEKLLFLFNIRPEFTVVQSTRDFQRGFFEYLIRCDGYDRATGALVGSGLGSANIYEKRYTRIQGPPCQDCNQPLKKGRSNWFCPQQEGGCGRSFGYDKVPANAGTRVENDDRFELDNTLLKMAQKRGLLAMTLVATAASGMFTQDVEDLPAYIEGAPAPKPQPGQPQPNPQRQPPPGQQQRPQEGNGGAWTRPTDAPLIPHDPKELRRAMIALVTVAEMHGVKGIVAPPEDAAPAGLRGAIGTAEKRLGMTWKQALDRVTSPVQQEEVARQQAKRRISDEEAARLNREQAEAEARAAAEYEAARKDDDAVEDEEEPEQPEQVPF